jgi:hypothetical protein
VFVIDCANEITLSAKMSLTNLSAVWPSMAECSKLIPARPSGLMKGRGQGQGQGQDIHCRLF